MLLNQFHSFYNQHFPDDMEQLIEYFSIFGGLDWDIDIHQPLESLIEDLILDNYGHLSHEVSAIVTLDDPEYYRLLSAIAVGDRRIHSACKRAHISEEKGNKAIDFFRQNGIINIEYSREVPPLKLHPKQRLKREIARHRISHKIRFTSPFLRFWFYFIAPMSQSIEHGEYEDVLERFKQRHASFTSFIFEELSLLLLEKTFEQEELVSVGSYWDRQVELDILARTRQDATIVGECKWTNTKINKSELGKLYEKCRTIDLEPDVITLFSKRGFSNELLHQQNRRVRLFSAEDFAVLLEGDMTEKPLLRISLPR